MSFCAHKTYGPKGIGALYVRRKPRVRLEAQMHGGGHERGLRSGTLATHQIVGMGEAFRLARLEMAEENKRVGAARPPAGRACRRWKRCSNGDMEHRVPHNLNISFAYVEGESLIMAIKDVAVSSAVRPAPRPASSRPTCCAPLGPQRRAGPTAPSVSPSAVSRRSRRSTIQSTCCRTRSASCANCRPSGKCTKEGIDLNTVQWAAALTGEQTWHTAKRSSTTTKTPQRRRLWQGRRRRRHRHGRRAGLRRRDEAADQGRQGRHHRGRQVQDLRLRFGDRLQLAGHRVGEGQDLDQALEIKNTAIAEELACRRSRSTARSSPKTPSRRRSRTTRRSTTAERRPIMAVTLSDKAATHIGNFIAKRGKGVGIRLGVRTSGCSGWPTSWSSPTRCWPTTWSSNPTASRS